MDEKQKTIDQIFEDSQTRQYQTLGKRFFASLFDSGCISVLNALLLVPFIFMPSPLGIGVYLLLVFAATYGGIVFMNFRWGGSPGKLLFEIKIVDQGTQGPLSLRAAFLRELLSLLLGGLAVVLAIFQISIGPGAVHTYFHPVIIPVLTFGDIFTVLFRNLLAGVIAVTLLLWFVAEFVVSLSNRRRRAIHDYLASTVVIAASTEYRPWARIISVLVLVASGTIQEAVYGFF